MNKAIIEPTNIVCLILAHNRKKDLKTGYDIDVWCNKPLLVTALHVVVAVAIDAFAQVKDSVLQDNSTI